MPIRPEARKYIQSFDLQPLFIEELGWDHCRLDQSVEIEGIHYSLTAIAEKRGLVAFLFQSDDSVDLPDYTTRRKIEKQIAKAVHEHMIIFVDSQKTTQVWQWVKREPGKPAACREHRFYKGQSGDALIQKLDPLVITLEEEDSQHLSVSEIASRVRTGFDVDRITKRFYDRFKEEHSVFKDFIQGITENVALNWYTSIMLNRLMFIYFIQKKGFLDNDRDYLRNRLNKITHEKGEGKFYNFYRYFLLKLFHEGLGQKEEKRDPELDQLLGKVPYLNGGLFDVHELEEKYPDIDIPDEAFQKLFNFFDGYQWHLDERPLRADNEINPDVLGYIFEKYINQKQMGAYYTKEDITEYIGRNTIVPYLFDAAKKECKIAFEGEQCVWTLLQANADRYIFPAVGHSLVWDARQTPPQRRESPLHFPPEISVGIDTTKPDLLERRKEWNKPAPPEFALPTEIWREVVARRQRYIEVREKLENGKVRDINDLITYNLDIRQFAQDVIESCEGPELLRAFWKALSEITILDPTCGSGAFLFAALNILEPLYEAALNRMQLFVDDLDQSDEKHSPKKYADFRQTLEELHKHPNETYFILKKIILNNLYGVDIMDEAVEICKLRLFLKLAAQVEPDYAKTNLGLEPLPDIDFNIRAGNTLVGFANMDEVKKATEGDMLKQLALPEIEEKAEAVDRLFKLFRKQQTELGGEVTHEDKQALRDKLKPLDEELNHYLASEYGVDFKKEKEYNKWLDSHKPFHWFVEFYGIMKQGGFDVIIGNPPYVATSKVDYIFISNLYKSITGRNLYCLVMERSIHILKKDCRYGMIIPVSIISGDSYQDTAKLVFKFRSWLSSFSNRPGKLFKGVEQRLVVSLQQKVVGEVLTTSYQHWYENERQFLFNKLYFFKSVFINKTNMPFKIGDNISLNIIKKILINDINIDKFLGCSEHSCFYHDGPTYWIRALPFNPEGNLSTRSSHYHELKGLNEECSLLLSAILSSTLFYFYYKLISNCRDFGKNELDYFKLPIIENDGVRKISKLTLKYGSRLLDTAKSCSRNYPSGIIEYDEYYPQKAKQILNEIDIILSDYYNLTSEEIDYLINYDIKYRMGIC